MEHSILNVIGYSLIWFAISYKRDESTISKMHTKDWLILFLSVLVAGLLVSA